MSDTKPTTPKARTGGHILIEQLARHGADMAFGVPGESYLEALDGLHGHKISFITCRQEGGAAMMADAYGKLTGRPGICFVTRGPGATNASAGVHVAFQDSTPMILLVGQVGRDMAEREAFQEIDYRRMFGQMAKWVAEIDDARRIPEFVSRAFYTATSGRPGPVVLALPEDMLTDVVETADAGGYARVAIHPGAADMARLGALLGKGRTACCHRRWRRLERCRAPRFRSVLCRPQLAGRRILPLPGLHRQRAPLLRWSCGRWHQSEAWRLPQGQRPAAGGRCPVR
jgi:acetolactate synthase I/II/III large subunit